MLTHAEILAAILQTLGKIKFYEKAGIDGSDQLLQKHLIVICVNELLNKVKEHNLDLARKDDFIFAFNGACWKQFSRETIKYFLGKVAAKLSVPSLEAQHYEFQNKLYLQFLSAAYFEPIQPQGDKVLINLQNGTFQITKDSQRIRDFSAKDFLTYILPFEYDESANCPIFQTFLYRVLPEKELQHILAEFFGYIFTKGLKMEKALLLYGSGANGKSVVFDVINALLGKGTSLTFLCQI